MFLLSANLYPERQKLDQKRKEKEREREGKRERKRVSEQRVGLRECDTMRMRKMDKLQFQMFAEPEKEMRVGG